MVSREFTLSVVTVCLNCADTIGPTVQSVFDQTYDRIELIVVDGGSTDGTLAFLQANRDRIAHLVSGKDRGIYDAMNKGARLATGDYILFLNAGDRFSSRDVVRRIMTNPEVADRRPAIVSGRTQMEYAGEAWPHFSSGEGLPDGLELPHQATFLDTQLQKNNPFDIRYRFVADHELWRRLQAGGALQVYYVPDVVSIFALGGASSNPRNDPRRLLERSFVDYLYSNRFGARDWMRVVVVIGVRRLLYALLGERRYYLLLSRRRAHRAEKLNRQRMGGSP